MAALELEAVNLEGLYTKFGEYASPLAKYFTALGATAPGNVINYDILAYRQNMSPLVSYGGPPPSGKMPTIGNVSYKAVTTKQKMELPLEVLRNARDAGSLNANEREHVRRAVIQVRMNIERRLDWLRAQWLTGGALLSSSGVAPIEPNGTAYLDIPSLLNTAPLSVSLGYSASHIDAGASASWATATTDILADLDSAQAKIALDSGIERANRVICNSVVWNYVLRNDMIQSSIEKANAIAARGSQQGTLPVLLGYEWDVIDAYIPFDPETMETDTGALGQFKLIPDNVVVVTTADNIRAGRILRECKPDDYNAGDGDRGIYAWSDLEPVHPHQPSTGFTWTGGVELGVPDSTYIYTKVTDTS